MRACRILVACAVAVAGGARTGSAQSSPPALSRSQVDVACAPSEGIAPAARQGLRILGAQDTVPRSLYGLNELVVLSGGRQSNVQLNQEYVIRRPLAFGWRYQSDRAQTIHTAGWLRVVAVNDTTAIAQIQSVCDGVLAGDYLEPFAAPAPFEGGGITTPATLDFSALGRVKSGDEQRRLGAAGDFMLVDSGQAALAPGVRVAVYRDVGVDGLPLMAIGEGVIVAVTGGTPVMRISSARDAVQSGDFVVPHK